MRMTVFGVCLYWGPLVLGHYHIEPRPLTLEPPSFRPTNPELTVRRRYVQLFTGIHEQVKVVLLDHSFSMESILGCRFEIYTKVHLSLKLGFVTAKLN